VQERAIRDLFYRFDAVQLDMRADTR